MLKRLVLVVALVAALAVPAAGSAAPPAQSMFNWSYWYPNSPYYGYLQLFGDGAYYVYDSANGAYDQGYWQVFAQKQLRFVSGYWCYGSVGVYQWRMNPFIGLLTLQRVFGLVRAAGGGADRNGLAEVPLGVDGEGGLVLKRLVLVVALVAALAVPAAGSAAPPAQSMLNDSFWYPNSGYYGYLYLYGYGPYYVYNSATGGYDEGQWQVFAQKQLRFVSWYSCYGSVGVYQWRMNPFIGLLTLQRVSDSCGQRVAALNGTVWRRY